MATRQQRLTLVQKVMFGMSQFGVTGEDAVLRAFTIFHQGAIIELHAE